MLARYFAAVALALGWATASPSGSATSSACTGTYTPQNPPRYQVHCGVKGYLTTPRYIANRTVTSLEGCAAACGNNGGCTNFGYRASANQCQLYSTNFHKMGLTDDATDYGTIFYTQSCWGCSPAGSGCPTQVLLNTGFEYSNYYYDALYWTSSANGTCIAERDGNYADAYSGQASAYFQGPSGKKDGTCQGLFYQNITCMNPGQAYNLSAYVYPYVFNASTDPQFPIMSIYLDGQTVLQPTSMCGGPQSLSKGKCTGSTNFVYFLISYLVKSTSSTPQLKFVVELDVNPSFSDLVWMDQVTLTLQK